MNFQNLESAERFVKCKICNKYISERNISKHQNSKSHLDKFFKAAEKDMNKSNKQSNGITTKINKMVKQTTKKIIKQDAKANTHTTLTILSYQDNTDGGVRDSKGKKRKTLKHNKNTLYLKLMGGGDD